MKPMRHSIGNMVVNSLASVLGLSWQSDRQCCGFICETENEKQEQIILLKPRLLMNVNGRSIAKTGNNKIYVVNSGWLAVCECHVHVATTI